MESHKIVSHDEWVAARKKHLAKEKELTRLRDQLSRERRELPWELVEKDYTFEGESGKVSLHDMFGGRSQLVVYHAMFNPDTAGPDTSWTADAACFACSWWMDNFNGITVHLNHRDITMVAVSLLDELPRQIAPLPAQLVAHPGKLLLLRQVLLPCLEPLVVLHHLVSCHVILLC